MNYTKYLLLLVSLFATSAYGQTITTIAGGIGDGMPATAYGRVSICNSVGTDNLGNLYIGDMRRIRKLDFSTGLITTIAGTGEFPSPPDPPVPALYSTINDVTTMLNDGMGNFYFSGDSYLFKIDATNTVTSLMLQTGGYGGDGGPATAATANWVAGVAIDPTDGGLVFADYNNNRIRKIYPSGVINTIAGITGAWNFSGDGGPALTATMRNPKGLTIDAAGNIYFADTRNHRIRKISTSGTITTVVGTGNYMGSIGDGGPATAAELRTPVDVKVDAAGNLYIADGEHRIVRKVNTSGIINTVAGTGTPGFSGDGGPATAAQIFFPNHIALDNSGNLYIADYGNFRVRKVDPSGTITTAIGNLPVMGFGGDGGPALKGVYKALNVITSDRAGNLFVVDDANNARIRKISAAGIVTTYAGTGTVGYSGDGGPAVAASMIKPAGLAIDGTGNLYIADEGSHHVRKISASGIITTFAGGGSTLGDGGPATAASISPRAIAVDSSTGNVYISDGANNRVRKIDATSGIITTVAASENPSGLSTDGAGNVYLLYSTIVKKVDAAGTITTIAGGGSGFTVGVPANTVGLSNLNTIATDKWGNIFVGTGTRIYQIDKYGYIHIAAGNGKRGYMGDQGSSESAQLWSTKGLAADTSGNVYVTDDQYNSVRKICCFNGNADQPPLFTHTSPAALPLCSSAGAVAIDTFLSVSDGDTGDTLRWSVVSAPTHGTLGGFTGMAISTGGIVTPTGLTYAPASGYAGTDNFTIRVTDGIDISTFKINVTITAPPTTNISGASSVCAGDSIQLTGTPAGGTWSVTNSNATVTTSGKVFGLVAGLDTIRYTAVNGCGTVIANKVVIINPLAAAGAIGGPTTVCVGSSISLTNAVMGGVWSSASPYLSVNNVSGIVVGYAPGTAVITYTKTNSCGSASTTTNITVSGATWPGTISGGTTICTGGTTSLSTSVAGGTWSSGNVAIASVGTSGIVTGNAVGATIISYEVAGACGNAVAITIVNVSAATPIGPITGASAMCMGGTATLTNASASGTWSSSTPSIATINSAGVVTGVSQGITAISYVANLGCGTSVATFNMVVNAAPNAGTITNPATLCAGATAIASSYALGGTWSVSNGNASVGPTGILTGVSAGSNTITYTVTNSCGTVFTTSTINIYPAPNAGAISGASVICAGTNTTLTNAVATGSWSSSNTAVATIGSANGIVSGISGGTVNITYTDVTGCGTAIATKTMTVDAPNAGVISGATSVCAGGSSTLSSSVSGGTWSSSAPSVATINSSGVVSALAGGATIISYATTNGCGTAVATTIYNVGSLPLVSPITGTSNLCVAGTSTLSDATVGGVWSSSNTTVATINSSGVLTGMTAGSATISYMVTAGCGTAGATYNVIIDSLPPTPTVSGSDSVCTFGSTLFTASAAGGYWSSSNSAILAITATTGAASGVTTGTAIISYSVSNVCGTTTATKNTVVTSADAGTITGTTSVCAGNITTLTGTIPGGTWMSSNAAVATVDAYGVVSTLTAGISVISYATTGLCGVATATTSLIVGILPVVTPITGSDKICEGTTTTLSNATLGGSWSSSNTSIATVSGAGVVSGIADGNATISYSVTAGCGTSTSIFNMQIETELIPASIIGNLTICAGTLGVLTGSTPGGTWISGKPAIASIDPLTGTITGISGGVVPLTYTIGNSCKTVTTVISAYVQTKPKVNAITGLTEICNSATTTLLESTTGGVWSVDNETIADLTPMNMAVSVQGSAAGTAIVSYSVANQCGVTHATTAVSVHGTPYIDPISGATIVVANRTLTLTDAVYGGVWSSSDNTVATVNNAGEVTGLKEGVVTISYAITNNAGCDTFVTKSITVKKLERGLSAMFHIYPNPAKNSLTLSWDNQYARYADVVITDMLGRFVYSTIIDMPHESGKTELDVANLVPAVYNINIKYAGDFFNTKLVIVK